MPGTTVPMSIRLDVNAREKLKAVAMRQKRSAHALKHFDETGLHASHEEVMTWMATWGTDKELPAPVCHP